MSGGASASFYSYVIAKFVASGKVQAKKNLGLMQMHYSNRTRLWRRSRAQGMAAWRFSPGLFCKRARIYGKIFLQICI